MRIHKLVGRIGALLISIGLCGAASAEEMEEVVVTGSYIKGTPEDAALPVDVMNREDLEDVGDPTLIEMVRNLGVTSGNLGETGAARLTRVSSRQTSGDLVQQGPWYSSTTSDMSRPKREASILVPYPASPSVGWKS